jgi:hypothetical protein
VVNGLKRWQTREGVQRIEDIVGAANPAFKGKPAR